LPRWLARFNAVVTNRLARVPAEWLPGLGVVVHHGRRTGREYSTPVDVFPAGDGFVVPLTYGADSDWVRNVLAEGGCTLIHRGGTYRLSEPRVVTAGAPTGVPTPLRPVLGLLGVHEFLVCRRTDDER